MHDVPPHPPGWQQGERSGEQPRAVGHRAHPGPHASQQDGYPLWMLPSNRAKWVQDPGSRAPAGLLTTRDRPIHSGPGYAGAGQPGLCSGPCRPLNFLLSPTRAPVLWETLPLRVIIHVLTQMHALNKASLQEYIVHTQEMTPKSVAGTSPRGLPRPWPPLCTPHPGGWDSAFGPFMLWLFFLVSVPVHFPKQ